MRHGKDGSGYTEFPAACDPVAGWRHNGSSMSISGSVLPGGQRRSKVGVELCNEARQRLKMKILMSKTTLISGLRKRSVQRPFL